VTDAFRIPVAVSVRHLHPSQATIWRLFGTGHCLTVRHVLSQPGQFAAEETVSLVGPAGRIDGVRLLGPPRSEDQVELSRSDAISLGIPAPLRLSGQLAGSPGLRLVGPAGEVDLAHGVIVARRHLHVAADEARLLGLRDGQLVQVRIDSDGRDLVFGDIVVRVGEPARLELHLDTDEGNAASIAPGAMAELLPADGPDDD
jgi:propanediol utilization protein